MGRTRPLPPPRRRSRRVSPHAVARREITLAHLKFADYVRTGDEVAFTYRGSRVVARVLVDGRLATPHAAVHTHATAVDEASGQSTYVAPTPFALDAMAAILAAASSATPVPPPPTLTTPGGFDNMVHVRTGRTLNALRDAFMRECPTLTPPTTVAACSRFLNKKHTSIGRPAVF